MSLIVKAGKAGKRVLKKFLPEEKHHVSYTRRIERVQTGERVVAMTFDDGPMDLPSSPDKFDGRSLTDILLDTLAEYDAKGTFDVVGDTSENYPDVAGKTGQADWGGVKYDHYPDINQDDRGGVVHNPRLVRRILDEGHQITNHSYRHVLFGKKPFVYGKRDHFHGLDEVVADLSRTEKTICLAVTPSLKSYGISGRARLFEVIQRVKEVNAQRQRNTPGRQFTSASSHDPEVRRNPSLALDYIVAPPRMAHYIDWSTRVYSVYLKHVAPEDIYPYSIDEVFIDATSYLQTYHLSAREFARKIILDILQTTGITAAAGIGTNLYLAKVAMDIGAKHVPADEYGVRIAELDEMGYRRSFWTHRPLTDFWRVGKGYAAKLEANGLYTMGDIARCSIGQPTDYHNEELLYKLFGVNAELLIDHAWGWEPCTIADIKAYKPENKSIVSGQILQYPYPFEKARLVIQEMADALALELVDKRLATNQLVLTVGYDIENLKGTVYTGEVTTDRYGRKIPKHAHGTVNLDGYTSSGEELLKAATSLYDRIVDKTLLARRLTLCANHLLDESSVPEDLPEQIDLFTDYSAKEKQKKEADTAHARERKLQETMLDIKKRFGKNAILKGLNLEDGATARERNNQIGGHKA